MRKITREAVNAFMSHDTIKIGNTHTEISFGYIYLCLHGNLIASKSITKPHEPIKITLAGWNTNTTRERLNGLPGVRVTTKHGQAYLNGEKWGGEWKTIIL